MTVKPKGRSNISQGRQFKLNLTTRAIRNALALGLAMATTTPVLAGTCDVSDPANAVCDGSFLDTNISFAIDDLTIVVGGAFATDIEPLDGSIGIDLYAANGSISLTSAADIVTLNAAAISVRAPNGDVHVENRGNLQTFYADGIEASSGTGDVFVHNAAGASIFVTNAYGNANGIDATSMYGDVSILNEGVVDVSTVSYGNATGINANARYGGAVSVINSATGVVVATTDNTYGGTAIAIRANSSMGGSLVDNAGNLDASATAEYGDATSYGVLNRGGYYGDTSTINTGTITSTASTGDGVGWAWGIRDRGRTNAEVDNSGEITVEADAGTGYATASGTYVRAMYAHNENSGSITADASVAGVGTARAYGTMTFGYYASMDNSGDITATSHVGEGVSTAIGAISYYNIDFAASNTGTITANAYATIGTADAIAIRSGSDELTTIYNGVDGSLVAHAVSGDGAAFAYGAFANSDSSSLANYGSISADATTYQGNVYGGAIARATGASIQAEEAYDASVVNGQYGDISAKASVHSEGTAYSFGVIAYGQASGRLENHGDISAESFAESGIAVSVGSVAAGGFGVTLNYGSISANATVANDGFAQAIGAYTQGQVATLVNEGVITATGDIGSGEVTAIGGHLYGAWNAAYNYLDITASASATTGEAIAYGINSFGVEGSSLFNAESGRIVASADVVDGIAVALGTYNTAYVYGAYVTNDGSIAATASVSGSDSASIAGAIGVQNTALLYGDAVVVNNGDVSAGASANAGYALAKGVYNFAYLFDASVTNAGSISAAAFNAYGYATAFGVQNASVYYGDVSTANTGSISAIATVDIGFADATGVDTVGSYDGTVSNEGLILASATADTGYTRAIGIKTYVGGAAVTQNFGDITATATGHGEYGYAMAAGASTVVAFAVNNTASMDNHGVINATATADGRRGFAAATGTSTFAKYAGSVNYGSINVVASAGYTGVAKVVGVETAGMLRASTTNHDSISVQAVTDQGYSAARGVVDYAYTQRNANATTVNYGDINVIAYTTGHVDTGYGGFAYAWGLETSANHYATVHNAGSISVQADAAFGVARAVAVSLDSRRDGSTLTNDGDIYARANGYTYHAVAVGSDVEARGRILGATTVNNEGASIIAIATADHGGYAGAIGSGTSVWGVDGQAATMTNHGDIIAIASASGGHAFAKGQHTLGNLVSNNFNYGNIIADAQAVDGLAVAEGNKTWTGYGDAALVNAGIITARADAGATGEAFAYGSMLVSPISGSTDNAVDGTIRATAIGGGDGLALAIGNITAGGIASVVNHGDIAALALTTGNSNSTATGVATTGDYAAYQWAFQYFHGNVYSVEGSVTNDGNISATAISEFGTAAATGVNSASQHGTVTVANTGTITAGADGAAGSTATGISLDASGSNSLSNDGDIFAMAQSNGGIATALGLDAVSQSGDVSLVNTGSITAAALGGAGSTSIAVSMESVGSNTLTNTGSIVAMGTDATRIAVSSSADAAATIDNAGLISGAILTGGLDDTFTNNLGAIWNDVGQSDFGAGNNAIFNAGTIHLKNASITLGSPLTMTHAAVPVLPSEPAPAERARKAGTPHHDPRGAPIADKAGVILDGLVIAGNTFNNSGRITVSGDNQIDLGAQNPNAFINTGTIDFWDGAHDGTLTINGDFGGDGEINLEASAMNNGSDVLYIDGNVVDGSVNTINVALVELPTFRRVITDIPVVHVTGDSAATSFAMGDGAYIEGPGNFLALAFNSTLIADIDPSNATDDVFSLRVTIKGLNRRGMLAASIAPGVQSLMASQVGSSSGRVGVVDKYAKGGLSMWTRQDNGTANPAQVASNFIQGSTFGFDQQNSSTEGGVGFAVSDEVSLGALVARAEASQTLDEPGAGLNKINGGTYGVYGNWTSPLGFYLDASYRWMSFDARMISMAGQMQAKGDAETFNLEAGYAWTSQGGLKVEPQFQYTRTLVDNIDTLSGALGAFHAEAGVSSRGRMGVAVSKTFDASAGAVAWAPYASVSAVREFDGRNAYAINDALFGETNTAGTSALVETGLNVHAGSLSVFGGLNWQDGGALDSFMGGQMGVRYTW